ncbi:signal peptidase II [Mycoplasmopsis gallinarum]|uniref:Lipoprotein signal peptidase n=1 Tax=Mycoplasmopsis gallinarum TaxID=29557 RepID=A0A168RQ03_9BACT|nr:signal peptidase II [Mycoplasmopsis gallinarum]OAB49182.1 Lipoprotein signal peptidase [Mycoplasmopsis gallinarum]
MAEINGLNPKRNFKEIISEWWKKRVQNFQTKINEAKKNPKKLAFKYLIVLGIAFLLVLIDQLTKTYLFNWNSDHTDGAWTSIGYYDFGIIGIRSIGHYGVTIIPLKKSAVVINIVQTISILIILVLLIVPFYSNNWNYLIITSFIIAGDFGNMLDRFIFEGGMVKDILFIPFLERWTSKQLGTFNFADACIIIGGLYLIIYNLANFFKEKNSLEETEKKESE